MKKLTALPAWWGLFMVVLAGVFAFPAIGHLMEGHHVELWQLKESVMGSVYSNGILVWSYISLIIAGVFIATGIQILVNSDPKAQT